LIFEIKTISRKRFLVSGFTGGLITVVAGISAGIFLDNHLVGAILLIVLFIATLYCSHFIARTTTNILIEENPPLVVALIRRHARGPATTFR